MKYLVLLLVLFNYIQLYSQNSELIDKKAFNYYTKSQIDEMPLYKIHQTNYLINNSFIVDEESINSIDLSKVDGLKLGAFRNENERVKVNLDIEKEGKGANLSKSYIILLSHKEVDKALIEIKVKYNNQ